MQPSPELEAIMRRFLLARRESDFDRIRNILSLSEYFIGIGSGEGEWIDADGFQRIVQSDWDSLRVTVDDVRKMEAFENGNTGWVVVEAERTIETGHSFVYRATMVFVMEAGQWRVIHIHFSVPVEDEVLQGPALTSTLSDLLASMRDDETGVGAGRTATVVFTDIVGSTALSQSMGDATWSETIDRHFAALRSIVEGEGGQVVKTLGDGGMYVFDTARAALRAVERIRGRDGDDLSVRIGVHTGDLVVSADDYVGTTVAKAARVTAAADGGEVLVSSTTVGMANPTEFSFGSPRSLELAGLSGVHVVHALD